MEEVEPRRPLDFSDTQIAFSGKSDKELKKMNRLFKLMNMQGLVKLGSSMGLIAVKLRFPFVNAIVRNTVFEQFCGGENLLDCQKTIDKLYKEDALTILDYGAEGKTHEEDLEKVTEEIIKAIELAASNNSVPVVSTKITGLVPNEILIKLQEKNELDSGEQHAYDKLMERVDRICAHAHDLKVGVFIDAEESWLQDSIDDIVEKMMIKYNKERVIVFNTYQLYRHDKLAQLKADHQKAIDNDYLLGAKLVRGAYMEKERAIAKEKKYPSPIQKDKDATDTDFNEAIRFCVDNYETISSCCASHNEESNMLQAQLIESKGLDKSHPHLNFCQLYGMSDNITFNLAQSGYNVAKYVPYGPIREVMPYLIRRTQENTSITGEMGRELKLIKTELKRRGL